MGQDDSAGSRDFDRDGRTQFYCEHAASFDDAILRDEAFVVRLAVSRRPCNASVLTLEARLGTEP